MISWFRLGDTVLLDGVKKVTIYSRKLGGMYYNVYTDDINKQYRVNVNRLSTLK